MSVLNPRTDFLPALFPLKAAKKEQQSTAILAPKATIS